MSKYIKIEKSTLKKVLIITIIIFGIWIFLPSENTSEDGDTGLFGGEDFSEINDQFSEIQEYHYPNMPITYSIDINTYNSDISDDSQAYDFFEEERIRWALQIIEDSTDNLIQFEEVGQEDNPDMFLDGVLPSEGPDGTFVTKGYGGPTRVEENIIIQSGIVLFPSIVGFYAGTTEYWADANYFYSQKTYDYLESSSWKEYACDDFPNTEVHEILHTFGLGHVYDNSYLIMAPILHRIQSCQTSELDEATISCLKYIYSNGEIKGDCSDLNMYPWPEEEEISDFRWDNLPIKYSISKCGIAQENQLRRAENIIEEHLGYDLYERNDSDTSQVNFNCRDSFDDILLNKETDSWDGTTYFPGAQPLYNFEDGKIKDVEIALFSQDKECGGLEVHELLHVAGLRNHYGRWMQVEFSMCSRVVILDFETLAELNGLYGTK